MGEYENTEGKDESQECFVGRRTVPKRKHKQKYGQVYVACVYRSTITCIGGEYEEIITKQER